MRLFYIEGREVVVCRILFQDVEREAMRQAIKEQLDVQWVWWEDEIGTINDPIRGPNPQFGPGAMRN